MKNLANYKCTNIDIHTGKMRIHNYRAKISGTGIRGTFGYDCTKIKLFRFVYEDLYLKV